jgi:hypothetical protein
MNISLFCKWWWKLDTENGLWQQIIKSKYLNGESICTVKHRQNDSPIWADLLKIRNIYLQGRKMVVRDCKRTLLWKDIWLNEKPLYTLYSDLFKICDNPDVTIYQVKLDPQNVTFTRWLVGDLRNSWGKILTDVENLHLVSSNDLVQWKFGTNGLFSVKSVYKAMIASDNGSYHQNIWKGKIPAKIKIFLWLVMNNAILTKNNMIRRNWSGDTSCYFCDLEETIPHLLFQCSVVKAVWAIMAHSIGATDIPSSLDHCWDWCNKWLPFGKKFHAIGIAAICWAIWKNKE